MAVLIFYYVGFVFSAMAFSVLLFKFLNFFLCWLADLIKKITN